MLIGFHGNGRSSYMENLAAGAKKHGFHTVHCLSTAEIHTFDILVVKGFREHSREFAKIANKHNVPVIVIDAGHLRRKEGYWQIGINNLNWVTPFDQPSDRFDRLNLAISEPPVSLGEYILLCGQVVGDAQHPFPTVEGLNLMYERLVAQIKDHTPLPVYFRPHPGFNRSPPHLIDKLLSCEEDIFEQISKARCVVTYNSGAGNEALLRGIPVYSHSSMFYRPTYWDLSLKSLDPIHEPPHTTYDERASYFHRLAYSQWNCANFQDGEVWDFYIQQLKQLEMI